MSEEDLRSDLADLDDQIVVSQHDLAREQDALDSLRARRQALEEKLNAD